MITKQSGRNLNSKVDVAFGVLLIVMSLLVASLANINDIN